MTADVELLPCGECGMPCRPDEYHPFAACLMFKACHNSETVRANMEPLRADHAALRAEYYRVVHALQDEQARAERLADALRWALPLASQGLEMCRLERLRCGHGDITGTYKNGETWAGIHQEEVDGLERARAALEQEKGSGYWPEMPKNGGPDWTGFDG